MNIIRVQRATLSDEFEVMVQLNDDSAWSTGLKFQTEEAANYAAARLYDAQALDAQLVAEQGGSGS